MIGQEKSKETGALVVRTLFNWILYGVGVGILSGTAASLFLRGLDWVTATRMTHSWLLFLLPVGGAAVSYLYKRYGSQSIKGNNLIIEQIQSELNVQRAEKQGILSPQPEPVAVPLRMAPLVLLGTWITHLLGGSAGREGTAVQLGGSLADSYGRLLRVNRKDRSLLLICGIAGGFSSVFGTPLAGAVFGIEVIAIGLLRYQAIIPALIASFSGHLITTELWGVQHHHYEIGLIPAFSWLLLLKIATASILFGLTSRLFSGLTRTFKQGFSRLFQNVMLKSAVGGILIIVLTYMLGTREYLGLSLPLLEQAFGGEAAPLAFLWKLVFTSLTLGTGFQGGEVTPLFIIGATLGHTLAGVLQVAVPFLAALGFIAVFCGASNTPLACFIMGMELFGMSGAGYMLMACIISYWCSGTKGIYTQELHRSKLLLRRQ